MSAYIVDDETINAVISFLSNNRDLEYVRDQILSETGCDVNLREGRHKLGTAMFELNCRAVEQRYGEGQAAEFRDLNYQYRPVMSGNSMRAYKSLRCWIYQCSEGDVPGSSLLFQAMKRAADELAHYLVMRSPEFDRAKGW